MPALGHSSRGALVLAVVACTLAAVAAQGPECTTPDRLSGTCVLLQRCPPLFALLKGSGQPVSPQVIEFLRKSHCGFQGSDPKVCCPRLDPSQPTQPSFNPATPRPTARPTQRPQRPQQQDLSDGGVDVSKEPNLQLLAHDVCGPSTFNRIINGNKTQVFEFPWMARLGYRSTRNGNVAYRCGGSLINSRYVLTAAHCVEGLKSTEILSTVRLGENDIQTDIDCSVVSGTTLCAPPVDDVGVEETIAHPGFSLEGPTRLQNDVALVRMDRRVKFTEAVRPICLPVGDEQFKELNGKKVIVAGWGTTETGISSTQLLQVRVPVVKGTTCADVYKSMLAISPAKQICAGGTKDGDSCNGDSGGPLKFAGIGVKGDPRTMQFGIVSFGPRKCGSLGMPGVYTRVGYYMQWILRTMRP